MADHPFRGAGPDMVEALLRGAMTSPHVAADPVGGQVVARLFEQLAHTDSSRVGRLLSPQPGPAQFEVEVHRTGDIVPESVIRDLSAGGAIREAMARAGDPRRSVELVVVPSGTEDEVVLAARPGQPLTYLFTDDVRAKAAALPPPARSSGPPTGPVPIPQSRADSEHAYDYDPDAPAEPAASSAAAAGFAGQGGSGQGPSDEGAASTGLVPLSASGPMSGAAAGGVTASELTGAIEAALAEMSIQVDVAGVAELVQEAVVEHLRAEVGAFGGSATMASVDTDAVAERVAERLSSALPAGHHVDTDAIAQQVAARLAESLPTDQRIDPDAIAQQVAVRVANALPAERGVDAFAVAEQVADHLARTLTLEPDPEAAAIRVSLADLQEIMAARDRHLAAEQVRMQQQLEALHAQIQQTGRSMESTVRAVAEDHSRGNSDMASLEVSLQSTAHTLASLERAITDRAVDAGREVNRVGDNIEDELRLLGRRVESQLQNVVAQAQPSGSGDELRRVASDLGVVTERLGALVRYLDSAVDVRSLGRLTRSIERTALTLGLDDARNEPSGDDEAKRPSPRRRRGASVGNHPLRLVDDGADQPPPAADTGA